ncbi:MAG: hypothetical protein KDE27_18375 [Planctomycetes bacterium]|nr:hypothetical protein [Planctomycetota bacterium]
MPLPGQAPGRIVPSVTPIHTAPDDPVGGPYGTWATGADYKVAFHDGMVFVPYLGRDYPVTRTLSWRTEAARLGEVDLLGIAPPRHGHDDYRYEYRFGRLIEAYDVLLDGLEQTFVIAERAPGDLRIEGRFGGNLAPRQHGSEIAFADPAGAVLVTYGEAVAVDAIGRRYAVDTTLDGDRLTLQIPAARLADATFPLVVDPLLAPTTLATHGTDDPDSVDIARDDFSNKLAVCFLRHVSAVDQDAWVHEFPDDFTTAPVGTIVWADTNWWGIHNVRICNVGPARDWVMVTSRALPEMNLRYWIQPTGSGVLNTYIEFVPNPGTDNMWFADIGGLETYDESGAAAVGTKAMCVYQLDDSAPATPTDSTTVWAQTIDVAGAGTTNVLGTPYRISGAGNDHDFPSITKISEGQEGGPARWIAVWQRYDSPLPIARDWDVIGTQVFDDDTSAGLFEATGSADNDTHRLGPKVEGQRGRYLVAYGDLRRLGVPKAAAQLGRSMVAERFDWPNGGAPVSQPPVVFHGPGMTQQMIIGDVAYDADTDSQWTILDLDVIDSYIRVHRVGMTGNLLETGFVSFIPVGSTHNGLGGICYDDDGNHFPFAYGVPLDGAANAVFGRYLDYPAEAATMLGGPTCRPILPRWEGRDANDNVIPDNDQQIGNEFGHVVVEGTPAGTLHFLLLSTATANVGIFDPSVGAGCRLLIDNGAGFIGALPLAIGATADWNVPLPEFVPAFTLHTQDWFLDPTDGRIYSSYRLSVPLVK